MSQQYKKYQEGVVRSLLARPETVIDVIEFVDSKDFEDLNLKIVYDSIVELYLENKIISLPEIALKISEGGGNVDPAWLLSLEGGVSDWIQEAHPKTWAKLLKKESAKIKAVNILREGITDIVSGENDTLTEMDNISNKLLEVSLESTVNETYDIRESVMKFKEESKEIMASGGKISSISSAYPTIDYYTQGWGRTHLITVGARTGIGKSVFAINNAIAAMQQNQSVYFFSLEMTEREVISRMVASLAMIPILKVEKAEPLTEEELERQNEALEFIASSKLVIDTNSNVTADYIKRASIKQAHSENGLDFIIIDYLQLIQGNGKSRSRQEEVAEVSRSMKILAKELNVPVMVLVQLLREKRDEEDQVPKMYEIRESGAIAQDSNIVILIHRNKDKDSEIIDPKATFIIAKNRQGEDNVYISVRTRLESSLFIDENAKGKQLIHALEIANATLSSEEEFSAHFGSADGAGFDEDPVAVGFDNSSNSSFDRESNVDEESLVNFDNTNSDSNFFGSDQEFFDSFGGNEDSSSIFDDEFDDEFGDNYFL